MRRLDVETGIAPAMPVSLSPDESGFACSPLPAVLRIGLARQAPPADNSRWLVRLLLFEIVAQAFVRWVPDRQMGQTNHFFHTAHGDTVPAATALQFERRRFAACVLCFGIRHVNDTTQRQCGTL